MSEKICIVGYGSIGQRHEKMLRETLRNPEFYIVDPRLGTKIEDARNTNYDIVVICSPTFLHMQHAAYLYDTCSLMFVEKPIGVSTEQIKKYSHLFSGKDNFHVGANIRYTQFYNNLKLISHDAKMMNIVSISFLPSWGTCLTNNMDRSKIYCMNKNMGGSVLLDHIHEPDYVQSIFGLPDQSFMFNERLFDSVTVDSNDSCMMMWKYAEKKILVSFQLSYASKEFKRYCDVVLKTGENVHLDITKRDIELSYKKQWLDILKNGSRNTFDDCFNLFERIGI